jgi:hypothetical protein
MNRTVIIVIAVVVALLVAWQAYQWIDRSRLVSKLSQQQILAKAASDSVVAAKAHQKSSDSLHLLQVGGLEALANDRRQRVNQLTAYIRHIGDSLKADTTSHGGTDIELPDWGPLTGADSISFGLKEPPKVETIICRCWWCRFKTIFTHKK